MKAFPISIFMLSIVSLWGAILTVDNNSPSIGQYSSLQAAHDAASNGDKIYVMPSNGSYGAIIVTKQLEFIGAGWSPAGFNSYFIKPTKISGNMWFSSGSDGSVISGFGGGFGAYICANNVTVKRCYASLIHINENISNLVAFNNQIIANSSSNSPIYIGKAAFSFSFINNVIVNQAGSSFINNSTNWSGGNYTYASLNSNCYFINNTFVSQSIGEFLRNNTPTGNLPPPSYTDATMLNNIITTNLVESVNFHNNISGPDAQDCVSADYHTVLGSAAIDAGNSNPSFDDLDDTTNDCGAYGGQTPFVDGGITDFPSIYEIIGQGAVSPNETMQLQIKAKTN